MKKIIGSMALVAALGLNASALYFDGGVSGVTGPGGYRGTKLDLVIGGDSLAFEPSMASYTSDALDKTLRSYGLRVAKETEVYTLGVEAGMTPDTDYGPAANNSSYKNQYAGADFTLSLSPTGGGHARLAGPGSRGAARGGDGVTRIDVGVSAKYTAHTQTVASTEFKTNQGQGSLFAGAKIFMVNLSASYTGYTYGDKEGNALINPVPGHSFAYGANPKSSVNVKLDIPATVPMLTPYVSYTGTKYKGGVDNSNAYLLGAYVDLKMVSANIAYQIFNDGSGNDSFISLGAGVKF